MSQKLFDSISHTARLIVDGIAQEPIAWDSDAVDKVKAYRAAGHTVTVKLTLNY